MLETESWRPELAGGVEKIRSNALSKFAGRLLPSDVCALRTVLVAGVASSLLTALGRPADAAPRGYFNPYGWYGYYSYPGYAPSRRARTAPSRPERGEPSKAASFGEMPKGPLQIVVSIDSQRVTLFSNGVPVAHGPVSTGVPDHPTPMGVFSIIEKDRYHHSNLYSNAPMPYMQRITWSGVALHEGVLPGYPASHGCIRLSSDFAKKLWPITSLGARVVIARNEVAPVDFEHPKLFAPKPKPTEPQVAANATSDGQGAARPIVLSQATTTDANSGVSKDASDTADDTVKPAPADDPPKSIVPRLRAVDQPPKRSGQVAVFVSRKEMKIFVRQGMVPLFDMPVVIADPDQPLGTHVFTALGMSEDGSRMRWNLMTIATDPWAPAEPWDSRTRFREPRFKDTPKPTARLRSSSTAAEALNRIQMPKEAVDRIAELLIAGSSLVVSDEGLGRETGRYTEFIVLTR
jgi:L,D-transpeptidase catalytic domain